MGKLKKYFSVRNTPFSGPLEPLSQVFGFDRGQPIDRYYIEQFLDKEKRHIKGRVLEISENSYTKQFGGNQVVKSDILHADDKNSNATIIGDLATGKGIRENTWDCFILTQTLLCIYDVKSAIKNSIRLLKSNGVLLATVPCISKISRYDMDRWGDYWRFTDLSIRKLFEEFIPKENIEIETYGNVKVAAAFLYGLASYELTKEELDNQDPDYQVLITAVIKKP